MRNACVVIQMSANAPTIQIGRTLSSVKITANFEAYAPSSVSNGNTIITPSIIEINISTNIPVSVTTGTVEIAATNIELNTVLYPPLFVNEMTRTVSIDIESYVPLVKSLVVFGYTGTASSSYSLNSTYLIGGVFTSGAGAGTLTKITARLKKSSDPITRIKAAVYNGTTFLYESTNEITGASLGSSYANYDFTFSGGAITASTDYTLVLMIEGGGASKYVVFNRVDSGGSSVTQSMTYGAFPETATWSTGSRIYYINATYNEF